MYRDVEINIDPRNLRRDVQNLIVDRIGSITADSMVYERIMGAIWEGMQDSGQLPVDSGALEAGEGGPYFSQCNSWKDNKGRVHKMTQYERFGNTYVTSHARTSTLHIAPFERRPSDDVYYAYRKEDPILEARDAALGNPWVLSQIAEIVGIKFREKSK